jgi:hypothetical protein
VLQRIAHAKHGDAANMAAAKKAKADRAAAELAAYHERRRLAVEARRAEFVARWVNCAGVIASFTQGDAFLAIALFWDTCFWGHHEVTAPAHAMLPRLAAAGLGPEVMIGDPDVSLYITYGGGPYYKLQALTKITELSAVAKERRRSRLRQRCAATVLVLRTRLASSTFFAPVGAAPRRRGGVMRCWWCRHAG